MELKYQHSIYLYYACYLLIVPYGIEIAMNYNSINLVHSLLIVPYGIEIGLLDSAL